MLPHLTKVPAVAAKVPAGETSAKPGVEVAVEVAKSDTVGDHPFWVLLYKAGY